MVFHRSADHGHPIAPHGITEPSLVTIPEERRDTAIRVRYGKVALSGLPMGCGRSLGSVTTVYVGNCNSDLYVAP